MVSISTLYNHLHSILQENSFSNKFSEKQRPSKAILLIVILSCTFPAISQNPEWVKTAYGLNNQCGKGICTDLYGNCYVTGIFKDEMKVDSFSFQAKGQEDIFLSKYSPFGKLEWISHLGSRDYDFGKAVTCDRYGNIYLTGYFGDTLAFNGTTYISKGNSDAFIAKYSASGNKVWIKQFGGTGFDFVKDILLDKEGNIFIAGTFQDTIYIDNTKITSKGSSDIFTAKFDSVCNLKWISTSGGGKFDYGNGVEVDTSGNCISTGFFQDTAQFGDTLLISKGYYDIFISKYGPSGKLIWVKQAGGAGHDEAHAIGSDNKGNVYITGYFDSDCNFGNFHLTVFNKEADDLFIAKCTSAGEFEWVKGAGDFTNDIGYDIDTDTAGNSYITGVFYGKMGIGSSIMNSVGSDDSFIIKYDKNGKDIWSTQIGGTKSAYGFAVCTDGKGTIFSTGYFSGKEHSGKHFITSTNKYDMFVNKITE